MNVLDEEREKDLADYYEIIKQSKTLLILMARKSGQHSERIVMCDSVADGQLAAVYVSAAENLKKVIQEVAALEPELVKMQPERVGIFKAIIRFIFGTNKKQLPA